MSGDQELPYAQLVRDWAEGKTLPTEVQAIKDWLQQNFTDADMSVPSVLDEVSEKDAEGIGGARIPGEIVSDSHHARPATVGERSTEEGVAGQGLGQISGGGGERGDSTVAGMKHRRIVFDAKSNGR